MEVKVAKTAGFLFLAQRCCRQGLRANRTVVLTGFFTLGPIIHNEEVVNDLENKGGSEWHLRMI